MVTRKPVGEAYCRSLCTQGLVLPGACLVPTATSSALLQHRRQLCARSAEQALMCSEASLARESGVAMTRARQGGESGRGEGVPCA